MLTYPHLGLYDLISPDGYISFYQRLSTTHAKAIVKMDNISPAFQGFVIDTNHIHFNIKSVLAQLGLDAIGSSFHIDHQQQTAEVNVDITAYGPLAQTLLQHLTTGVYLGKLFAADERRKVRDPDYLLRMFRRNDMQGRPLLYLGDPDHRETLTLEKKNGFTVAFLRLLQGTIHYTQEANLCIPALVKALCIPRIRLRGFLHALQTWQTRTPMHVSHDNILLVRTQPLHIRTAFAKVCKDMLPKGYFHTSADVLQPDTKASGDIYELHGTSTDSISSIPLEFFTLEPYREHVFFSDRDQLQSCLESQQAIFQAFETAPAPSHHKSAVFVVKGSQLVALQPNNWITKEPSFYDFPGVIYHAEQQATVVDEYIKQQPSYPFFNAMGKQQITSQGILLSRFLPSPLMKQILLERRVRHCLKGIYFESPSHSSGGFFSHEDRAMLHDLAQFGIPVYWADRISNQILQYTPKPRTNSGMFAPLSQVDDFLRSTSFGIYGSNLISDNIENELQTLFIGLEHMRYTSEHPLLNSKTPIAIITGGGPGSMEMGNKIAKKLHLLSCANIMDFRAPHTKAVLNEQKQNPYVDIKMTYRLDRLVERQAEFYLDFPIFLTGGIGTDFEYALEEVRRKVGSITTTPILLFGDANYWKQKITSRFQCNLQKGTIAGSEWISNCFYCVQTARQALKIYQAFFTNNLNIGKEGKVYPDGFITVESCDS